MDEPIRDEVDVFATGRRDECESVPYYNAEFAEVKTPDGRVARLRRCPFCGYPPEFKMNGKVIRCTNRSCKAEQCVYNSVEEAVWHWNKRSGC